MFFLSKTHRYFLHRHATDMRNGFDGLSGIVRNKFLQSPLSGDVFIFINHRRTHIKLLQWQGDGFAVYYKRLEKGTYEFPLAAEDSAHASASLSMPLEISSQQLLLMLEGIALLSVKKRVRYQPFSATYQQ